MFLFWSLYIYLLSHPKITALRFCAGLKDTVKIPMGKYEERIILNWILKSRGVTIWITTETETEGQTHCDSL